MMDADEIKRILGIMTDMDSSRQIIGTTMVEAHNEMDNVMRTLAMVREVLSQKPDLDLEIIEETNKYLLSVGKRSRAYTAVLQSANEDFLKTLEDRGDIKRTNGPN
ncbi:MAG: hypothetical protein KAR40_06155 [Candidatus Sabulitectum sp.]|nr:hypothetical protein [Candidatus Sabulitectum sp.]